MSRFKIISTERFDKPSSKMPKNSRSYVKAGFSAMGFTVEDTKTGQEIVIDPIPFTASDPKYKRNVEILALKAKGRA